MPAPGADPQPHAPGRHRVDGFNRASLPLTEFEALRTSGVVAKPQPAIEPPAATDDEPRLGDTARALLLELHTARAFNRPTLATLSELAPKLGKGRTAEDLKRPSAELGRAKLVDSQSGRGGGVWLTVAGKRYADDVLRADGHLPPDGNGDKR